MRDSNLWRRSASRNMQSIIGNWRFAEHSLRFRCPAFRIARVLMKMLFSLLVAIACYCAIGCSSELETGYKPHALNSSSTLRRGYYASPFTPEAEAANRE